MLILPQRTQNNAFNIFIWTSLFVGLGMQMCLYSIEWYARQNCPRTLVSLRLKFFDNRYLILDGPIGLFCSSITFLS